ncbi:DUF4123 domain-containing protein [Shewanella sp. YLB-07]|uniref:DUF4123 domain-containing protein n=1 Tax=Shewanella sp. YLB-07 TaxID=2601268 RepID=UPI00128CD1D3|nr:DUF4123 domain-containing protein [Shewanella sp. YLB-07]MPY21268.1 DUF4123 domain-containing protein [Shewanella sp. YLB-07]MPY22055.1 DUF4123 domain-containing protein [Shewanella sp. YLB-07]
MQHTLDLVQADITQSAARIDSAQYAIIEPLLCPDITQWLYEEGTSARSIPLFSDTPYQSLAEEGPLLIELAERTQLISRIKSASQRFSIGCFIQSGLSFEALADLLAECLTINSGQNLALFRFYEPRMLLPLMMVMSTTDKQHFFQGITSFIWFDKQWLSASVANASSPSQHSDVIRWTMTAQQGEAMQQVLTQWQQSTAHSPSVHSG